MVEPVLVHYPSHDGKWTISALLYVPFNMPRNGQNAAIVYVHGGPASQTVNSFNRFVQHIVNQGYMVIAPNYRGSTGYGKEFQHANLFDMGGGDLQDVLGAAEFLKQTGFVDPKKLVLMGGSYGGYLTMMGVTKAPEVWAAGVPIVPFVNWFTEIENEDPILQQSDIATMGDPKDARTKPCLKTGRRYFLWTRSRRRCCCWLAGMIRGVRKKKLCRWPTRSRKAAAWRSTRFMRTRGMGSRGWRTRLMLISGFRSF